MERAIVCAYAAGFLDGEGAIMVVSRERKHVTGYELKVSVTQADRTPLEFLKVHFGGNINTAGRRRIEGYIPLKWVVSNAAALSFLRDVLPFLILKKKEAEIALDWPSVNEYLNGSHREARRRIMQSLKECRRSRKVAMGA